jgi:hypothetical protein
MRRLQTAWQGWLSFSPRRKRILTPIAARHHARQNGCFFEINSSPDRLDLSAEKARLATEAGVKIAISTDAQGVQGGVKQIAVAPDASASGLKELSAGSTQSCQEPGMYYRRPRK